MILQVSKTFLQMIALVSLRYIFLHASVFLPACNAFSMGNNPSTQKTTIIDRIRSAMAETTKGQSNITAAHAAIALWDDILTPPPHLTSTTSTLTSPASLQDERLQLQPAIRTLCKSLYASSLTRVGRDASAVNVYDDILSMTEGGSGEDSSDDNDGGNNAVQNNASVDESVIVDVRIGRGEALQRLMNYDDARMDFIAACQLYSKERSDDYTEDSKRVKCAYSAALCSMRLGDWDGARSVLSSVLLDDEDPFDHGFEWWERRKGNWNHLDPNLVGLYGVLVAERLGDEDSDGHAIAMKMLDHGASSPHSSSPIYKWFRSILSNDEQPYDMFPYDDDDSVHGGVNAEEFLQIASINQSPFDDPDLIQLDDKVLLHDLLTQNDDGVAAHGWPDGFVLPRDDVQLMEYCGDTKCKGSGIGTSASGSSSAGSPPSLSPTMWMMKERAGYGSHGNSVVASAEEAMRFARERIAVSRPVSGGSSRENTNSTSTDEEQQSVLCQRLIDPSMLFHGRKFSIQVYMVYFNGEQDQGRGSSGENPPLRRYHLLDVGLAKLAESKYDHDGDKNDNVYMTNSGRMEGDFMLQYDLESLRNYMNFEYGEGSFVKMWREVEKSVSSVMGAYEARQEEDKGMSMSIKRPTRLISSVPKIMGFDYIMDHPSCQPWLMEVNRFPGLEARGDADDKVKRNVVTKAWQLAIENLKVKG